MSGNEKKIIIILIITSIIAIIGAQIYKAATVFKYEGHLDEVIISVDDNSLTLREFGYYIYTTEEFVQKQAVIYDPEDPLHWWNTHFSAGLDSQFVSELAMKTAINTYLSHAIYYAEAQKAGMALSSSEEEAAQSEADEMYQKMSPLQLKKTGLNESLIYFALCRKKLASKYAEDLATNIDFSGYEDDLGSLLSGDGDYFQNVILPQHNVVINEKLMKNIKIGRITVNNT